MHFTNQIMSILTWSEEWQEIFVGYFLVSCEQLSRRVEVHPRPESCLFVGYFLVSCVQLSGRVEVHPRPQPRLFLIAVGPGAQGKSGPGLETHNLIG